LSKFSEWYRNNQFHNGDGRMDYAEYAWNAQQKNVDKLLKLAQEHYDLLPECEYNFEDWLERKLKDE
jgi:hypothetical protein